MKRSKDMDAPLQGDNCSNLDCVERGEVEENVAEVRRWRKKGRAIKVNMERASTTKGMGGTYRRWEKGGGPGERRQVLQREKARVAPGQ